MTRSQSLVARGGTVEISTRQDKGETLHVFPSAVKSSLQVNTSDGVRAKGSVAKLVSPTCACEAHNEEMEVMLGVGHA